MAMSVVMLGVRYVVFVKLDIVDLGSIGKQVCMFLISWVNTE
jgi:hypothetical protein